MPVAVLVLLASPLVRSTLASQPDGDYGVDLPRERIESLLKTAEIEGSEPLPIGVTRSHVITLREGELQLKAIWKTVDKLVRIQRHENGRTEFVRDSYKHEIAAYELDKLLGLHMVPPTVERKIGRHLGAVQLWLDGTITEKERRDLERRPPELSHWNRQVDALHLFHELIDDNDYKNIRNILIDPGFRMYIIDSSRAFGSRSTLRRDVELEQFSTRLLERLHALTFEQLHDRLGRWLSKKQLKALLARRDLIVARAERLATTLGADAVLLP